MGILRLFSMNGLMVFAFLLFIAHCQKSTYVIGKQTYDSFSAIKIKWDHDDESLRILSIYYETTNVKVSTTSELIDLPTFISNVGGNLGLFVGFSVLGGLFFIYDLIAEARFRLNIAQ